MSYKIAPSILAAVTPNFASELARIVHRRRICSYRYHGWPICSEYQLGSRCGC